MEVNGKEIYDAKTDPTYANHVIDRREERVRVLCDGRELTFTYIHGYFEGTSVKFTFCFPDAASYGFHFIQHLSPFPGPDEEDASLGHTGPGDPVGFAIAHGFAFVESNMGSAAVFGSTTDPTIFYKSNAACAELCRKVSADLFGEPERRVYGYVFGGSGGGYKTMSCIENTNAYDGGLPFVIGSPVSLPNCLTVAVNGMRTLRNCWRRVVDATEPGGSGNIYEGLSDQEARDLRELVRMGVPPRTLTAFAANDDGALPVLLPGVKQLDPTYFEDFWTKPGYEGTDPAYGFTRDHVNLATKVTAVRIADAAGAVSVAEGLNGTDDAYRKMLAAGGDGAIEVEEVPEGDDLYLGGIEIVFTTGEAVGERLALGRIEGKGLVPKASFGCTTLAELASKVKPGDEVLLTNSDYLAVQAYHRHQIPTDPSFTCFEQFRDEDGKPIPPQRDQVISFGFTAGGCGSVQDGHVQCKTIVMNNLMDGDFPWQADWYRRKIEEVNGADEDLVRLYYNDNAPHGDVAEVGDHGHLVSYLGMLFQGLLDLSAWVEKGVEPAPTSGYTLVDSQVELAVSADERQGLQPLVLLSVNGEKCAHVYVGESVRFEATVEPVPRGGSFEDAELCTDDREDAFSAEGLDVTVGENGVATVAATCSYDAPGTYFAVLRAACNRTPGDPYTRLLNLDRVRVVVE